MEEYVRRNIEEFSKRKKRQFIVAAIAIPILIAVSSLDKYAIDPMLREYGPIAGFGGILSLLIFSYQNWRCPACDKYLGKSGIPKFCPKCAAQISK